MAPWVWLPIGCCLGTSVLAFFRFHSKGIWFCQSYCQYPCNSPRGWLDLSGRPIEYPKSKVLVRLVAACGGIEQDLGVKGKSGILTSMETRAEFLSGPSHRIRFVYIPKHTSWLNQLECWYSIWVRRLICRTSCVSIDDVRQQNLAFIDYFNCTMAKPFQEEEKAEMAKAKKQL